MTVRARSIAAACAVLVAACGGNAGLEIELELPPIDVSRAPRHAIVEIAGADGHAFGEPWDGAALPAIALGDTPATDRVSASAEGDAIDVHVRVRFCASAACDDPADAGAPEAWYVLRHPFYFGERTWWTERIAAIPSGRPSEPTIVDRCAIRGCVTGVSNTGYCRLSGAHFCEAPE